MPDDDDGVDISLILGLRVTPIINDEMDDAVVVVTEDAVPIVDDGDDDDDKPLLPLLLLLLSLYLFMSHLVYLI